MSRNHGVISGGAYIENAERVSGAYMANIVHYISGVLAASSAERRQPAWRP